jgi:hypothetical protein
MNTKRYAVPLCHPPSRMQQNRVRAKALVRQAHDDILEDSAFAVQIAERGTGKRHFLRLGKRDAQRASISRAMS